jgi:hypothetical protein
VTDLIPDDDGFTELVDPHVPRVDLVGAPANGAPGWLLMKQDAGAGLLDPDYIRGLIGKSEPTDNSRETVTMSGSPGAIARLIHEASLRHEATGDVTKMLVDADPDDGMDALDPTVPLAEPDSNAPGSPTEPGSPAWETVDAATACKWTAILARARAAVELLADREMLEAASADPDDADNAMDLQDAACAIDYAISILAPFAVAEETEAAVGAMDVMAAVGKALAAYDSAGLDTIEAATAIRKAGRSLSAANEQAIRDAVSSLQTVLASLPAAPVEKTANEEQDMPSPTTSDEATSDSGQQPAMGSREADPKPEAGAPVAEVGKADGEKTPMVVVYDQKGRLIGIVDPADVIPVANAEADADDMDSVDGDASDDDTDEASDDNQTADLAPQPADQAGTPADAVQDDDTVTKSTTTNDSTDLSEMFKSSLLAAVEDVVTKQSAAQAERLATIGDAVLEVAGLVETLKGRIGVLEEQPAEPKVFTQGAGPRPLPQHLRGHDQGTTPTNVDLTKAAEFKKQLYTGGDAGAQQQAFLGLQEMAIAQLAAMRRQ